MPTPCFISAFQVVEYLDIYDTNISKVEEDIPKIQKQVESFAPVSDDPDEVQKQLQETEDIQNTLTNDKILLESAIDASDWLTENANAQPSTGDEMKKRIEKNKEPLEDLSNTVNERQNALKCSLVEALEFKTALQDFVVWMNDMDNKLDKARPVVSDVNTIRELKREHKVNCICQLELHLLLYTLVQKCVSRRFFV